MSDHYLSALAALAAAEDAKRAGAARVTYYRARLDAEHPALPERERQLRAEAMARKDALANSASSRETKAYARGALHAGLRLIEQNDELASLLRQLLAQGGAGGHP